MLTANPVVARNIRYMGVLQGTPSPEGCSGKASQTQALGMCSGDG
jgi:hypothetical protein